LRLSSTPNRFACRDGYSRAEFRHWNAGDDPADGCNTRAEVLIHEAVTAPTVGAGCRLSGGSWWSYYDATVVASASGLDIDHMVALAEAWDSDASAWTAQRREAYANDQRAEQSLVAVTARSNPSKADQDPTDWLCRLPPGSTAGTSPKGCAPSSAGTCPSTTANWPPSRMRPQAARTRR
jgi:hypothetical protein